MLLNFIVAFSCAAIVMANGYIQFWKGHKVGRNAAIALFMANEPEALVRISQSISKGTIK